MRSLLMCSLYTTFDPHFIMSFYFLLPLLQTFISCSVWIFSSLSVCLSYYLCVIIQYFSCLSSQWNTVLIIYPGCCKSHSHPEWAMGAQLGKLLLYELSLIPRNHVEKAGHHVHPCDPSAEAEAEAGECLLHAGQPNILGELWVKETLSDKKQNKWTVPAEWHLRLASGPKTHIIHTHTHTEERENIRKKWGRGRRREGGARKIAERKRKQFRSYIGSFFNLNSFGRL